VRENGGGSLGTGPATSRRTFAQGDFLAVYAEIYDSIPAKQTHTIEIATHLLGEDGREVFTSRETHDGAALQGAGKSSIYGFSKQIPLAEVAPGRYLLQVEAQARGNPKDARPITQETVVTVVPGASK
jgi:hypothetical protein